MFAFKAWLKNDDFFFSPIAGARGRSLEELDSISRDFLVVDPTYLKAEFYLNKPLTEGVTPATVAALELKPSLLISSISPVMLFLTIEVRRSSLPGSTSLSTLSYSC